MNELHRIWHVLNVPAAQRFDFMIKYVRARVFA
jgi:hypothetical protein